MYIYCGDHIKLVNQVTYTQYVNQNWWKLSVSEYNNKALENYNKSLQLTVVIFYLKSI